MSYHKVDIEHKEIDMVTLFFENQNFTCNFQRQDDGPTQDPISASLGLVSDADTIRENIVDEFSCDGRVYGYYADVANDCQLFHVCYPVLYPDGQEEMIKWSFICPNQTIFDQARHNILVQGCQDQLSFVEAISN